LKPSSIYDVISILIPDISISSLANKLYSNPLEFGPKKCNQTRKNKFEDQIKKKNKKICKVHITCKRMKNATFNQEKKPTAF
jgi:hypothetical protein